MAESTPTVLFLCPHHALRSVIAAALFNQRAAGRAHAESAGTEPYDQVNERTVQVLGEIGIDVTGLKPQRVKAAQLDRADRVISLDCPLEPELLARAADKLDTWPMPDTTGKPVEAVREVRDLIGARVEALLAELDTTAVGSAAAHGAREATP
jgi:arsenate reductase